MKYVISLLLLTGCGRAGFNCKSTYGEIIGRYFGPYEQAKCHDGEVVSKSYLEYEPGGALLQGRETEAAAAYDGAARIVFTAKNDPHQRMQWGGMLNG